MSDSDLYRLADGHGIDLAYVGTDGHEHRASPETLRALLRTMGVPAGTDAEVAESLAARDASGAPVADPVLATAGQGLRVPLAAEATGEWAVLDGNRIVCEGSIGEDGLTLPGDLAPGRFRLHLTTAARRHSVTLLVAPARCHGPGSHERRWGLTLQLYGAGDAGAGQIGDLGSLALAAEAAGRQGAGFLGLNPLHALFPADPHHFGPYGPSSRSWLNSLYIDLRQLEGAEPTPALDESQRSELIDYPAVDAARRPALEAAWRWFGEHASQRDRAAFETFRRDHPALESFATFEALHEHHFGGGIGEWQWRRWPDEHRHPEAEGVARFAAEHAERVAFFAWLQWLADTQLGEAARRGREAGLSIGLYGDLAVGTHPGGAAAWSRPDLVLTGATVGAPPDDLGPEGQDWGITALSPKGLIDTGFQPFEAMLEANMRHFGALRIDHAMSLKRLYWIPDGFSATEGAYIRYPYAAMTANVAIASARHRCIVIGEDLGTVPPGFREAQAERGILSYRVLPFEKEGPRAYRKAADYPALALATAGTHDMPPLAGWRRGSDTKWRGLIGGHDAQSIERDLAHRRSEEEDLAAAIGVSPDSGDETFMLAVARFLAATPAALAAIQIEDLVDLAEQANLPGTVAEHPNWRRRLPDAVERILESDRMRDVAAIMKEEGRE